MSWDGEQPVVVARQPPSVRVVFEGSLEFQFLVTPEALRERFRTEPPAVVHDLLRETGKRMDERGIRDQLVGGLRLDGKVVTARLPGALDALRRDPHIRFSPEYERPCYEWSDVALPAQPDAFLKLRPWPHLLNDLAGMKLTQEEREVLRRRVADDRPDPISQRLALAAVEVVDWPDESEIQVRMARSGVGRELADLRDPMLRVLRKSASASGRGDVLWMLVLTARKCQALRGLGADLGDGVGSIAAVSVLLGVLRAERRSAPRGKDPEWWPDVVSRLPRLSDARLVAGVLSIALNTTEISERHALAGAMETSALVGLPEQEFAQAIEDVDAPRAVAFCQDVGLTDLATRIAGLSHATALEATQPRREAQSTTLDTMRPTRTVPQAASAVAPAAAVTLADPEQDHPSAATPDLPALFRSATDRAGLVNALQAAIGSNDLRGIDLSRVLKRMAETDEAFADAMRTLQDAARVEGREAEIARATVAAASRAEDLAAMQEQLQAAHDREASIAASLKAQQQRADRLAEREREIHRDSQLASDAERRQWRIDSLWAAVDLLGALDRAVHTSGEPREFAAIMARHGLIRVGQVGEMLPFDPVEHELMGDSRGELVKVIQPGYSFRDGETTTVLKRAVVTSRRE